MAPASGTRLGPYEIVAKLGEGGMGEVYRAKDTRLKREVAVKVLPEAFARDPERLARFQREAEVLAALNHPNIAHVYGLETLDGPDAPPTSFIAMELVEGEELSQRIARGPMPLDDALPIARQIAEALEMAHEIGVVHRDLKPGNIMLTAAGVVKVLDFGLAKALDGAGRAGGAGEARQSASRNSPTITPPAMTQAGIILGTAAYMAPEQAKGKAVDKRADIWAFGCVLFELLSGRRVFEGDDVSDTLALVLTGQPDLTRTPPQVRRLLERCLEKDPKRRLRDIADWWLLLDDQSATSKDIAKRGFAAGWMGSVAAALFAAALTAALFLLDARPAQQPPPRVTRSLISVAPAEQLQATNADDVFGEGRPGRTVMALSPDGNSIVFSAIRGGRQQLYRRGLDQLEATAIPGTDDGGSPFFSPDGAWLGFWARGAIRKVSLTSSGPAVSICETRGTIGASWGSNDTIVFADSNMNLIFQVPASGGVPQALSVLDAKEGEVSHRLPHMLPGGTAVLFTVTRSGPANWNEARIVLQSIGSPDHHTLIEGGADARYLPTGHLLYMQMGTLMAVPFDLASLTVAGGPVGLLGDVMQAANHPRAGGDSGAGQFSVSDRSLAYLPGGIFPDRERALVWVNRAGVVQVLPESTRPYRWWGAARLSPDGQRIAAWTAGTDKNIWIIDLARGAQSRLTTGSLNVEPVWTLDGTRVTYRYSGPQGSGLYSRAWTGGAAAESIVPRDTFRGVSPGAWSPDGTFAFLADGDIWLFPATGDRQPRRWLETPSQETHPEFSPNGQYVAYVSTESRRAEVYVQSYPVPGPRTQISVNGGSEPTWSRDGRELFYEEPVGAPQAAPGTPVPPAPAIRMMAVSVNTGVRFTAGIPHALFEGKFGTAGPIRAYDVAVDGRFIMVQDKERPSVKPTEIVLVQNWVEELRQRVKR